VTQLHREFLRAGSDVLQTFTLHSTDDKLTLTAEDGGTKHVRCSELNAAACKMARDVAVEQGALVAGSVSQCPSYTDGKGKDVVQGLLRTQIEEFMENRVDFVIVEYYYYLEEIEWAIEEVRKTGLPVVATMAIGPEGDKAGNSPGQCAVRMARAGADVVGVNCLFDPYMVLDTIRAMKEALDAEGLKPFLMTQPNGFFSTGMGKGGYLMSNEYPLALESRLVSRFDVHKYARAAYELGVRYIGGCCGFEAYHIRAISEELKDERGGKLPPASAKHEPWGAALSGCDHDYIRARANRSHWENLKPQRGCP